MCGLCGFWTAQDSDSFNQEALQKMNNTLRHRGPEAEGYYFADNQQGGKVALAHARLRIIDLSDAANQPFWSADRRYAVVFNGEIYNFKDIIRQYNLQTQTHTDTEIIAELFARFGKDCVHRFNGMFVIVLYDTHTDSLYLFRDRLGIKPLYYYHDTQTSTFAFASELKAIVALPAVRARLTINRQAIAHYLYQGFIAAPETIYNEVHKFPQGHHAAFNGHHLEISPYWQPEQHITSPHTPTITEAKKNLSLLLDSAIKYRLISDVPIGTFLSGGIDSSLVTAYAQQHADRPLQTFTIAFQEARFNEAPFAQKIAQHLGTQHHEIIVSYDTALQRVTQLPQIYDEPFADSSAIPSLLVSEAARKNVTVALAGDGGDELFLGYGMYTWAERFQKPWLKTLRYPLGKLLTYSHNNRLERGAKVLLYDHPTRLKSHILSQESYLFSQAELRQLLRYPPHEIAFDEHINVFQRPLKPAEMQSLFDLKHYLPDDLLVKMDRASMHHSLEVRLPLLDYRLVQFALNLPYNLKKQGNITKFLLRELLFEKVPAQYFDRPKQGFAIPLAEWLQKDLRYLIDRYLSAETVQNAGYVRYEQVESLKRQFFKGKTYLYNRIWALIVLHQWHEEIVS